MHVKTSTHVDLRNFELLKAPCAWAAPVMTTFLMRNFTHRIPACVSNQTCTRLAGTLGNEETTAFDGEEDAPIKVNDQDMKPPAKLHKIPRSRWRGP
jgi:hypothetical protein